MADIATLLQLLTPDQVSTVVTRLLDEVDYLRHSMSGLYEEIGRLEEECNQDKANQDRVDGLHNFIGHAMEVEALAHEATVYYGNNQIEAIKLVHKAHPYLGLREAKAAVEAAYAALDRGTLMAVREDYDGPYPACSGQCHECDNDPMPPCVAGMED